LVEAENFPAGQRDDRYAKIRFKFGFSSGRDVSDETSDTASACAEAFGPGL
jgi:hypothetical protein